ncbi:MAG: hypothetical protein HDS14_02155 [Bacteroides sp.]|nr:hypothetical protein [Bacteroides sp.]
MKDNREAKISYWAAHLTTIVSVTLVLLIVGVIAMMSLVAARETNRLKEKIELSVVMADSVSNAAAQHVYDLIAPQPYVIEPRLITREQALANWEAETGEDLEQTFGVNPLSPEIAFRVAAQYTAPKSLEQISARLKEIPGVEEVAAPDASMVSAMNSNIERMTIILGGIAIVLVIISFVLIHNTVHLSIHSRRFTIHTMQLVGATNGFIRAPFIRNNLLCGVISGLIASALLALTILLAPSIGVPELTHALEWKEMAIVAGALVMLGALLCLLASAWATTRFLHRDYDQLIRN